MIAVITGGTGGAKFVDGLRHVVPQEDLVIIVNTGDDLRWWGLQVSPDIDSIMYVLAGVLSDERGWGVKLDTFNCLRSMKTLGEPAWFSIGDRDLATHLLRTQLLAENGSLSHATSVIATRLGVRARVLPMSDSSVKTRVMTTRGDLSFEEYFVQRRHQDDVLSVYFAGAKDAEPASGVEEALRSASAVLIAPSNPITSIGPVLAVPGIRDALRGTRAPVAAVSPIIGNAAVSGPAGSLMRATGFEVSIAGVADVYSDFLDALVVDESDSASAENLRQDGLNVVCTPTLMRSKDDRVLLARAALEAAAFTKRDKAERVAT